MPEPEPGYAPEDAHALALREISAANLFAWSGMALYALFALGSIAALIPPHLQDPLWLQTSIRSLIANAMFPVVGTCLLMLAGLVDHQEPPGEFWLNLFRRWAWIGALGYLLLIPLQGYATIQLDRAADAPIAREIRGLRLANQGVRNARSMTELAPVLARLPGSPTIPANFNVPLERFRAQILETLSANENRLTELRQRQARARRSPQWFQSLQTALSCLIIASAFVAAAQSRDGRTSPLQRNLMQMLQLRRRPRSLPGSTLRRQRGSQGGDDDIAAFIP